MSAPYSLNVLILRHEFAFLLLVVVTGLLGGVSTYFWRYNSDEAVRISEMYFLTEQIRSDLYAQIQQMIRARVLEDNNALEAYPQYSRSISELFNKLRQHSRSREHDHAIQNLNHAYREIQNDMNNLFNDPYMIDTSVAIQLLDNDFSNEMIDRFEHHQKEFQSVLSRDHEDINQAVVVWTQFAPFILPIPVFIAILILIYTRRVMRRQFIQPIANIINDAGIISQGQLDHHVAEKGVEEVRHLSHAINKMAQELATNRDILVDQEKQAMLGSLVPVVAHNIRNPLGSIRATAQLLDKDMSADDLIENKHMIIETIDRLGRWVNSLVGYLHPLKPNFAMVKASDMVSAAIHLLTAKCADKNIEIVRLGWENDRVLRADPNLMEQVFHALLNNAVDATPDDQQVQVFFVPAEDYLEIHIHDSGQGIPFQPKAGKLEPGPSTKRYGTGLGIPLAFKICQVHGWNLSFKRDEVVGTNVVVSASLASIREEMNYDE